MKGSSTFEERERIRKRSNKEHDLTLKQDKRKKTVIEIKAEILDLAKDIREIANDSTTEKQVAKLIKEIATDSQISNKYPQVEKLYKLLNESADIMNSIKKMDAVSLEREALKNQRASLSSLMKPINNEYKKQKEREEKKVQENIIAKENADKLKELIANEEAESKKREIKEKEFDLVYQAQLDIAREANIKRAEQSYENIYEHMKDAAKIFGVKTAKELKEQQKEVNILIDEMNQFHDKFAKLDQFKDIFKDDIERYQDFIRVRTKELEKESIANSLEENKAALGRRLSGHK